VVDCKSCGQLKLAPSKLSCRFSAVTIRAANVTFFDLVDNHPPRAVVDHPRNLVGFQRRLSVIEVQDKRVGLTAVDAGMAEKVRE